MKKVVQLSFLLAFSIFGLGVEAGIIEDDVDHALSLLSTDRAECLTFTQNLLKRSEDGNNLFGLVKSNYILGYVEKKNGDYGKSILYYLEGIRYAKDAEYKEVTKDLVNLLQNAGNIFRQFGNYNLSRKYYTEAMKLALDSQDFAKYGHLIYLTGRVLKEEKKYNEATDLLETAFLQISEIKKTTVADIYNQLGLIYTEKGDKELALLNFNKLLKFVESDETLATKYNEWTYHNIGNLYFHFEDYTLAADQFKKALDFKLEIGSSNESLFYSYKDLSESYIQLKQYNAAEHFLNIAEPLMSDAKNVAQYYELYKFQSIVKRKRGDLEQYSKYQDLYASSLENYLIEQRHIEAADKKYNLDLITQRYFALVAEQDHNQQIQYYSAVGGSFLVTLIVLIIAFFQYRKYRLRKDLEASLRPYIKNAL